MIDWTIVVISRLDHTANAFPRHTFETEAEAWKWIDDHELNEKWPQSVWEVWANPVKGP